MVSTLGREVLEVTEEFILTEGTFGPSIFRRLDFEN
jgi:hypothetical protein